jgi:two-component system cell cycle sensor histidine kinase/response regulator CckA
MKQKLKTLYIEDSVADFRLIEAMLQEAGFALDMTRVESRAGLMAALKESPYDLILSDCTLPQFNGFEALEIIHALMPDTPFIFVSGTIGEEAAIECLHRGASDYVLKDRLARLVPSIRRALDAAKEKLLRKAMEKQLRQLRKLESIGRLAGGIAHDFNNLLQIFRMQLGMLGLEADNPEKVRQICETLDGTTMRGAEMMQELLIFARKTEAQLASLQIAERIIQTTELLRLGLPPEVTLSLDLDEPLPLIFADPGKIDRMLTNLVINSKDAMPAGGTIKISGQVVRFDPPMPNSSQLDDIPYLCLKVSDTGTGMDEYSRQHAFEPFFTNKPLGKGTGLGLAVVFGLMQVHNGLIDLQSKVGEGTTVSLYFPVPQASPIRAENIKAIPPFQAQSDATDSPENKS